MLQPILISGLGILAALIWVRYDTVWIRVCHIVRLPSSSSVSKVLDKLQKLQQIQDDLETSSVSAKEVHP